MLRERLAGPAKTMDRLSSDRPVRGIVLLVGATVFLAASDASAKHLTATLPAVQIIWMRYVGFALVALSILGLSGRVVLSSRRLSLQLARAASVLTSALLFVISLAYLPMADATAIAFLAPVFVTALASLFLGGLVGARRWTAVVTSLFGVLVIVRPGTSVFHPAIVVAVASALTWAVAIVLTRQIGRLDSPATTLCVTALVGLGAISLVVPFVWRPVSGAEILIGGFVAGSLTMGQLLTILAYRQANASVLAPFSYGLIVWSAIFGYFVFSYIPDLATLLGSCIIIVSGIHAAVSERRLPRV
jgi:drug/metabolite transporter (DMT)-like permease